MKRKAQEEMIGFALIIIIVAVILLVFLGFSLRNSKAVEIESYEVEGFLQSLLQITSDCEDAGGFLSVQDLIFSCYSEEKCLDNRNTCEVLNSTLKEISEKSWIVGEDAPIKGYELKVISEDRDIFSLNKGNISKNYRGASQEFAKRGKDYEISFKLYS